MKHLFLVLCSLLIGCSQQETPMETNIKPLTKTVLFGHQSVGANILDGIRDISPESIEKIKDVYIGQNRDPMSKIRDFEQQVKANNDVDVAMMKLCFVDIPNYFLPYEILEVYAATVSRLERQYPNIKFIHVTVPLTVYDSSLVNQIKTSIKKVLGRPTYDFDANKTRKEFNVLLRKYYPFDTVFDLAAIESDNERYQENGAPALNRGYTYDSGHLNEKGRQVVAKELVQYLNKL
jgi:hypothetical protein